MLKIVVLLKRRADLTPEQFRHHYENSHAVHAMKHFSHLWLEYRRNYPISSASFSGHAGEDGSDDHQVAFDAVTEIVLRDQAAFDEFMRLLAVPETRQLFSDDEAKFCDRDKSRFTICDVVQSKAYIEWGGAP